MQTRTIPVMATVAIVAVGLGLGYVAVGPAGGAHPRARAMLVGADGTRAGTVTFIDHDAHTEVRLQIKRVPDPTTALDAFHGFHIHANDDPANGDGCLADPAALPSTWFVSADGHWKADGQVHAHHTGDMPSVLILPDGTAEVRFLTDRIAIDALKGRAVVLHAGPDNFGNVPVGGGDDQYTPNGTAALEKTQKTGNAGDRIACGVVRR